ncbi:MAG: methionine--tRNA ligase subunit beta [Candidatus Loosdrechtia sp.]|uniref:methionine--tRNA ligase subunit beta n=1 Tax=Candidatus Loosdrechtia sp. TaxID=3101272 RepID=UPI003A744B48|nr:MAG: methionine--tRNA ligase subunit beta [Candidatus Jettenia sp. AMX2]
MGNGTHEQRKKRVEMISIEDFLKIDLRVAEVKHAEPHPNADKLLILKIDAGDGVADRQIVAGIRNSYKPEELVGKRIVIVNNLAPAVLRGVESQGMLLAAKDGDQVVILTTEKDIKPGSKVQ